MSSQSDAAATATTTTATIVDTSAKITEIPMAGMQHNHTDDDDHKNHHRKRHHHNDNCDDTFDRVHQQLHAIWDKTTASGDIVRRCNDDDEIATTDTTPTTGPNSSITKSTTIDVAINSTIRLLQNVIVDRTMIQDTTMMMQSFHQQYTAIIHHYEQTERPQLLDTIQQLQYSNEYHSNALTNLLQAFQESQTNIQDTTHGIRNEARLRAELSGMSVLRDEAFGQMEEQKYKVTLLQEQLTDIKIKLLRYQQEKIQSERHMQQMMHHTTSNNSSNINHRHGTKLLETNDETGTMTNRTKSVTPTPMTDTTEYYQRKYSESNQKVQSLQAMIVEKNRQIDELRYQVERNMNHQQYTNLQQQRQGHTHHPHPQHEQQQGPKIMNTMEHRAATASTASLKDGSHPSLSSKRPRL